MTDRRLTLLICSAAFLSGCTLEPFYHRPEAPVSPTWPNGAAVRPGVPPTTAAPAPLAADIGWRDFFTDPRLQRLIELSLVNNRDFRVSSLNVLAAQAQYRVQRADLFPGIDAFGSLSAQHLPGDLSASGTPTTTHSYEVGLGVTSYEVDLFGHVRSLNKVALENYFGYAETRNAAQIALVSQVAIQYLTWLADQALLKLTQDTLTSQQASYDLTKRRFDGGVATALDLHQAETSLDDAKVNLAQYTRQVIQDENALTLLIGSPIPTDLPSGNSFDDQNMLADLPEGLPSDLLTRRPDIRAAEYQLRAANANIGAARAAFFPSVLLTGSAGTASSTLSGLFNGDSHSWVFSPEITMPIFAGGANLANLDLAHVQKRIQIAQYEKTIQTAFREVADGLAGRRTLDDQLTAQEQLAQASSASYQLSQLRFQNGIDNYLTVMVSQREMYTDQQNLIAVKLLRLENLVTLYKALGGGWTERTNPANAAPPSTTPASAAPATVPPSTITAPT